MVDNAINYHARNARRATAHWRAFCVCDAWSWSWANATLIIVARGKVRLEGAQKEPTPVRARANSVASIHAEPAWHCHSGLWRLESGTLSTPSLDRQSSVTNHPSPGTERQVLSWRTSIPCQVASSSSSFQAFTQLTTPIQFIPQGRLYVRSTPVEVVFGTSLRCAPAPSWGGNHQGQCFLARRPVSFRAWARNRELCASTDETTHDQYSVVELLSSCERGFVVSSPPLPCA